MKYDPQIAEQMASAFTEKLHYVPVAQRSEITQVLMQTDALLNYAFDQPDRRGAWLGYERTNDFGIVGMVRSPESLVLENHANGLGVHARGCGRVAPCVWIHINEARITALALRDDTQYALPPEQAYLSLLGSINTFAGKNVAAVMNAENFVGHALSEITLQGHRIRHPELGALAFKYMMG